MITYESLEAASNCVDHLVGQFLAEDPAQDGTMLEANVILAVAQEHCVPSVGRELCATRLGWVPDALA